MAHNTALEGGSNYWYFLSEEAMELVNKAVPPDGHKAGFDACLTEVKRKFKTAGFNNY